MPINFWRTVEGYEVDFIIGDKIAIEIKTCKKVQTKHLKGLRALMEEHKIEQYYLISQDPIAMKQDDIFILPWETFIQKLWEDKIF